jgi:hypothetical protein
MNATSTVIVTSGSQSATINLNLTINPDRLSHGLNSD